MQLLILPSTLQYIAAGPGLQLLTTTTESPLEASEDEAETNYSLEPCSSSCLPQQSQKLFHQYSQICVFLQP
jgi:hypothetical protein